MIYKIDKRSSELPLKDLGEWAHAHDAHAALIEVLKAEFFNWANPAMTVEVTFRVGERYLDFYWCDAVKIHDIGVGDIVVNHSHVNSERGYRKDVISIYRWYSKFRCWRGGAHTYQFYGRSFPLGKFDKPMSLDWGVRQEPEIGLGSW